MEIKSFLKELGADFYCGVPDSQLKPLCDYLIDEYGVDGKRHLIAANEGNCTAVAAGYHLATGKVPVVYMQNSGEGNIINPVASLLNRKVYAIPCIFVIGWRGEPGVPDEPQHKFQGEITLTLLKDTDIEYFVVDGKTTVCDVSDVMQKWQPLLKAGKQVAFVVKKGALTYGGKPHYGNRNEIVREDAIKTIVEISGSDPVVSTTGKASRELYEIREANGQGHGYDFLTVGSMGHASSIALGIALNKPEEKVWCIDGDGAAVMHMGAMAVIGSLKPANLVHIVLNNCAHETVGGMPTCAGSADLCKIASACGYVAAYRAETKAQLIESLTKAKAAKTLTFIEVGCAVGSRKDLGRPATSPVQNKIQFMERLNSEN